MVTTQQFRDAMVIVNSYCEQLRTTNVTSKEVYQVGCRVKLSSWGLEMQGKRKKKLTGIVVDYIPYIMNPKTDGTAIVKWDSISKPDSMHISQLEAE